MVGRDVIARRVLILGQALDHLKAERAGDVERLRKDPVLRAAVERWVQLAIEACIDIAYHIVASRHLPQPDTARGAFETLAEQGLLDHDLASRLGGAASLRNVLVHGYVDVDLELLSTAAREDLGDLAAFGAAVARLLEEDE